MKCANADSSEVSMKFKSAKVRPLSQVFMDCRSDYAAGIHPSYDDDGIGTSVETIKVGSKMLLRCKFARLEQLDVVAMLWSTELFRSPFKEIL